MVRAIRLAGCLLILLSGFIICANITRLAEANPNYEASWGKVVFSALFAVVLAVIVTKEEEDTSTGGFEVFKIPKYTCPICCEAAIDAGISEPGKVCDGCKYMLSFEKKEASDGPDQATE